MKKSLIYLIVGVLSGLSSIVIFAEYSRALGVIAFIVGITLMIVANYLIYKGK